MNAYTIDALNSLFLITYCNYKNDNLHKNIFFVKVICPIIDSACITKKNSDIKQVFAKRLHVTSLELVCLFLYHIFCGADYTLVLIRQEYPPDYFLGSTFWHTAMDYN